MQTKHENIANILTDEILSGRYRPGDRLPSEREMAIRFHANRGAVREAMSRLSQLGVAAIHRGGARVTPIDEANLDIIGYMLSSSELPDAKLLDQIFQVIDRLLAMAAETVVVEASDRQIENIRTLVQRLLDPSLDGEAHTAARVEMMRAVMVTSDNLVCQLIARSLFEQFAPSLAAFERYVQLDVDAFTLLMRQLDSALAVRDRTALRAVFDSLAGLHRETMLGALAAASRDAENQPRAALS
ncbi:MAG: GntR family transcriptional regulator [Gammaproteobacteria bacterium]|nr:GntR family transcriptional regulator [Gammaproteobacteria bacterium]